MFQIIQKKFIQLQFLLVIKFLYVSISEQTFLEGTYDRSVVEEAFLSTDQIIQKYNYPVENHYVTTQDDYILKMHHLRKPHGQPVLLVHGLFDSSATWVYMRPNESLAYYLYDKGYDVWLGNVRGTRYSRNHTYLDPNDDPFWSFSWHEIGIYDLPAMIDYILKETGYEKLVYFGHSQGTTIFWVLCSMRPEYNEKILIMNALAPVAFMSNIKTPLLEPGKAFISLIGKGEFPISSNFTYKYCLSSLSFRVMCMGIIREAVGPDVSSTALNSVDYNKYLPLILGHVPAGSGTKQVMHYLQLVDSNKFAQYDYGTEENKKRYGRTTPPKYPLQKITAPVALYYTLNDYLSSEVDVQRLRSILPNVIEDHLYPYKDWNHVSMMWGRQARNLAHKRMLKLTEQAIKKGNHSNSIRSTDSQMSSMLKEESDYEWNIVVSAMNDVFI